MITFGKFGKVCIDSAGWVSSAAETDDGITVSFGDPQHISVHLTEAFMMRAYALMMENIERATPQSSDAETK